jgi:hypothetical protein
VISKYTELKTNGSGKEVTDADVVAIMKKSTRNSMKKKRPSLKRAAPIRSRPIEKQKAALLPFIPKLLSEAEIRRSTLACPTRACRPL